MNKKTLFLTLAAALAVSQENIKASGPKNLFNTIKSANKPSPWLIPQAFNKIRDFTSLCAKAQTIIDGHGKESFVTPLASFLQVLTSPGCHETIGDAISETALALRNKRTNKLSKNKKLAALILRLFNGAITDTIPGCDRKLSPRTHYAVAELCDLIATDLIRGKELLDKEYWDKWTITHFVAKILGVALCTSPRFEVTQVSTAGS
ncbi:hypothetical protein HOD08_02420 [bacterium]|nr:hypothetical protein [bacterium]